MDINIGTNIGTSVDSTTPVINDITAVFPSVAFDIIGSEVSIAVAPAGAIASSLPIYLAIYGMLIKAITSRQTLVIKAKAPISALYLDNTIADNEYQPKPAPMALDSLMGKPKAKPPNTLPTMLPKATAKGIKRIL